MIELLTELVKTLNIPPVKLFVKIKKDVRETPHDSYKHGIAQRLTIPSHFRGTPDSFLRGRLHRNKNLVLDTKQEQSRVPREQPSNRSRTF